MRLPVIPVPLTDQHASAFDDDDTRQDHEDTDDWALDAELEGFPLA